MSMFTISSGVTSSGLTVSPSEAVRVLSGGLIEQTTVESGGSVLLSSGASSLGDQTIFRGGRISGSGDLEGYLEVYGVESGLTFGASSQLGVLTVEDGGSVAGLTVYGGELYVSGIASAVSFAPASPGWGGGIEVQGWSIGDLIASNTSEVIIDQGTASGSVILAGGSEEVGVGGVGLIYGALVSSGGVQTALSGFAYGGVIGFGGSEQLLGGAIDGVVLAGGSQEVEYSAETSGTIVLSGGRETVAGSLAVGGVVASGGVDSALSGGEVSGTTVSNGGELFLASDGIAVGVTVSSGGVLALTESVSSGQVFVAGAVSAATTSRGVTLASGVALDVQSAVVLSSGTLSLGGGGTAFTATVLSGGRLLGPGRVLGGLAVLGSASGVFVGDALSSGVAEVYAGGAVAGVTIVNGAMTINPDALATSTTLLAASAGETLDYVYGSADRTMVGVRASQDVLSGGLAVGTVVKGYEAVLSGGTVSAATVSSGGAEVLFSGSVVRGVTVESGGLLLVEQAIASGQVVQEAPVTSTVVVGGVTLSRGAQADLISSTIQSGGTLDLTSGTVGNTLFVAAGGVVSGAGLLVGPSVVAGVLDGVLLGISTAAAPTNLEVLSGGGASGVTVLYGGLTVDAGGRAKGVVLIASDVGSGGSLGLAQRQAQPGEPVGAPISGGLAQNSATIQGVAIGTTIDSGAVQRIASGGEASGTIVLSGGLEVVGSGGAAQSGQVAAGGAEIVDAGALPSTATVASGGAVFFAPTVTSGATFKAGTLSAAATLSGVTVQSGGAIDVAGATVQSGGTLVLTSSGRATEVTVLAGGMIKGAGRINGETDDFGMVSGVTIGTGSASGLLEVLAGGVAKGVAAGYQGVLQLNAGGTATGSIVQSGGLELIETGASASGVSLASGGVAELRVGATLSGLAAQSGGQIILDGVTGDSAVVNGSGQLVVASKGVTVETIGLYGGGAGLSFEVLVDNTGGTQVLVGSAASASHAVTIGEAGARFLEVAAGLGAGAFANGGIGVTHSPARLGAGKEIQGRLTALELTVHS